MKTDKIQNPVIPGFFPDPSICRAGDDYYLVCSSFELYPGIPVFHSRNLADWELVGYAASVENGFRVVANTFNGGVMAPTIRFHDGLFYVIDMNFSDRGNFIVTAKDPRGPWSNPCFLPEVKSLDASLFFDDDDRAYVVGIGQELLKPDGSRGTGIFVQELDLSKMKLVGEPTPIFDSALRVAAFPEAPHIYKRNGWYYLLMAEGGTEYYHAVVTARSRELLGWFTGYPGNPVMTHRQLGRDYPLHNIGHADLVETAEGRWYAVMLGSRPVAGMHYNLGRETFLCPVTFEEDWPVFSPGTGKMEWEYPADPALPAPAKKSLFTETVDFNEPGLPLSWNLWGTPSEDFLHTGDGALRLRCLKRALPETIHGYRDVDPAWQKKNNVSFAGRRQQHLSFEASVRLSFDPKDNESAGLVILQAMNHQLKLECFTEEGTRYLRAVLVTTEANTHAHLPGFRAETEEKELKRIPLEGDETVLGVRACNELYQLLFGDSEETLEPFCETVDSRLLNPPSIGTFTGMMIGLFASGNGQESRNEAVFRHFCYKELPRG